MELQRPFCLFLGLITAFGLWSSSEANQFTLPWSPPNTADPYHYNKWAEALRFQVNDTLYFRKKNETDSVLVVSQGDYEKCDTSNPNKKLNDSVFKFDQSGPFYFISGDQGSCVHNQKMIVVVLAVRNHHQNAPPFTPQPSPVPVSPAPAAMPPKQTLTSPSPATVVETPTISPAPASRPSSPYAKPPSPAIPSNQPATSPKSPYPVMSRPPAYSPSFTPSPAKSPARSPSPAAITPVNSPSTSPSASTPSAAPVASTPLTAPPTPANPAEAPGGEGTTANLESPGPSPGATTSSATVSSVLTFWVAFVVNAVATGSLIGGV